MITRSRTTFVLAIIQLLPTSVFSDSTFSLSAHSKINYSQAKIPPNKPCKSLISLIDSSITIVKAELIEANHDTPAYCRVSGVIPLEIQFEVNLPIRWNSRFYMHGNGGLAGTAPSLARKRVMPAIQHGFATAYTDTGHDNRTEQGGSFAHNNLHKLIDYGFRAIHLTNQAARRLIHDYYGQSPAYSYWQGCSTGGRQGMISAQRFPQDFNGIAVGAPAHNYTGLKFSQAWRVSAFSDTSFTEKKVEVLGAHIYNMCDKNDGLEDGVIDDPRECDFDPARDLPRCNTIKREGCFSEEEISALRRYYSPVYLAGRSIYPAHPVGSEATVLQRDGTKRPGWVPWVINDSGPVVFDALGSDVFRYMLFVEDNPLFDWTSFDFEVEPDNLQALRDIVDAVDTDISEFSASGGKMISYFGWADPDINPLTIIDYHEKVAVDMGDKIDQFFRVFMVPGMFHCVGGPGFSEFDIMTPLINWVESNTPPESVQAATTYQGKYPMTRPLCPYPKVARYKGFGDYKKFESFRCEK
jgi:Tannase and feruloyl esterase